MAQPSLQFCRVLCALFALFNRAVMLAPIVDKALDGLQNTLKFKSKQQAFGAILVVCVGIALAIFGTVVAAWA